VSVDPGVWAQWASVAERYGHGWARASDPDLGWLVEALEPRPSDRALDLGAGAGHAALAVVPHVVEVVATDPTPEMLAVASRLAAERGLANVRLVEATVDALPFPAASFDLAFSHNSVHHWPYPLAGLREAPAGVRARLAIEANGSSFSVDAGLVVARLEATP